MFQPVKLGALSLKHRVAMAPLTRTRADPLKLTPTDLSVEYYKQRASDGGLLISEATIISPETMYGRAPGIWTDEQVSAWKKVCDAVHEKGGLISCQLWHIGRMAHPSFDNHPLNKASGGIYRSCVSASNIPAKGRIAEYGTGNLVPNATPRPLTIEEIEGRLVNDYVHAAKNAIKAGFDAVEVHSAHGYLLDQFLNSGTNNRTDKYGGSLENRFRIIDLIVSAISKEISPERVAVRLSPTTKTSMKYYGVEDTDPENLYYYIVSRLAKYNLAYLLLSEPRWTGLEEGDTDTKSQLPLINTRFRPVYPGKIIGAGGFSPNSARASIEKGEYDAIAFGRWFISNPDLPERLKDKSKELTIYNRKTFYVGKDSDADGYTDYPSLSAQKSSSKYRTVKQESIGANLANAKL